MCTRASASRSRRRARGGALVQRGGRGAPPERSG
jgi:hypothetical protein